MVRKEIPHSDWDAIKGGGDLCLHARSRVVVAFPRRGVF